MRAMKAEYGAAKGERVFYATAAKLGMKPKRAMSTAQRARRDRSTQGSPAMTMPEFRVGYRRVG